MSTSSDSTRPVGPTCSAIQAAIVPAPEPTSQQCHPRVDARCVRASRRVAGSATRASTRSRSCSRAIWSGSSLMRYDCRSLRHGRATSSRYADVAVDAGFGREPEHPLADHRCGAPRSCRRRSCRRTARAAASATRPCSAPPAPSSVDAELGALAPRFRPQDLHHRAVDRRAAAGRAPTPAAAASGSPGSARGCTRAASRWRSSGSARAAAVARASATSAAQPSGGRVAAADAPTPRARARRAPAPSRRRPRRRRSRPGSRTSVRNTSLKCAAPVIWRSGRTSMPGVRRSSSEERDAAVLRRVGIRAREQDREVAQVRVRRPHLLPVHDELVAVALGTRREVGEVAARDRLAEQLAPHLVGAQQRPEVARPLRVGRRSAAAPGRPCRPSTRRTRRSPRNRACSSAKIAACPAVPPRPPYSAGHVMPGPAAVEQRPLPRAAGLEALDVGRRRVELRPRRRRVRRQPGAGLGAERLFVHGRNPNRSRRISHTRRASGQHLGVEAAAATRTRRYPGWFLVALFAVTFVGAGVRIAMVALVHEPSQPGFLVDYDPIFYSRQANLVADGDGFIAPYLLDAHDNGPHRPSAGHPPLLVAVLAAASKLGERSFDRHRLVTALIGAVGRTGGGVDRRGARGLAGRDHRGRHRRAVSEPLAVRRAADARGVGRSADRARAPREHPVPEIGAYVAADLAGRDRRARRAHAWRARVARRGARAAALPLAARHVDGGAAAARRPRHAGRRAR